MIDPLLRYLAEVARESVTARVGLAIADVRPRARRIDRPGVEMSWGDRGIFTLPVPGHRFIPLALWWPFGTVVYEVQFEGQDPIAVPRSHFQEDGWYGFKLPSRSVRGGSVLTIHAGVRDQVPGAHLPAFVPYLEGSVF